MASASRVIILQNRVLKLRATDFFKALRSLYRLLAFIKVFLSDIKDFALKDKYRQKKRLTYQKIMDAADQGILI